MYKWKAVNVSKSSTPVLSLYLAKPIIVQPIGVRYTLEYKLCQTPVFGKPCFKEEKPAVPAGTLIIGVSTGWGQNLPPSTYWDKNSTRTCCPDTYPSRSNYILTFI